ncbi:MAG: hypothetical protein E7399_07520 [Ruminococcaceae bacterium]|nr:hypothetical protein [Oscillospiraceae bacterium]
MEQLSKKCSNYFKMLNQTSYEQDHPIKILLNQFDTDHPGLNAFELKGVQYEILAEKIDVVVWEETPFYFINNLSRCPGFNSGSVSNWLFERNCHIDEDADPETWRKFKKQQKLKLFLCCGPYCDNVHYTVSVENLVKNGMKKYYLDAEKAKIGATKEELDFLECAQRGLLAAKRICQWYAEKAYEKLKETTDPNHRKNLELLIQSANHAPWEAPSTFFEGLNACWFARNVLGAMEGIGNCTLGRVDYLLYDLYLEDIKTGRLTKDEAYHLIKQFVLLGDNQYDKNETIEYDNDSELEMGFGLGGCDQDGNPVYNELTTMFLRAHREMNCIYPKIHARFASDSPTEYLEELAQDIVSGRSVMGLSCDDGIIPGLIHDGRRLEDARSYETAGCWDNIVPNKEAMSCANYIYSLTVLEQAVYGPEPEYLDAGFQCTPLEEATSFEEVYQIFFTNLKQLIRWRCKAIGTYGKLASKVNPLCLTSALRDGSIQSKKDYTQGGSVYNKNNYAIVGFANYVDAMLVIKKLCFDEKIISLKEFLNVVRANWENNEDLLHQVRKCPHFGDNNSESNALSRRLHLDLCHVAEGIENEHGETFS